MRCEVEESCENAATIAYCGHYACDEHTDELTSLCLHCVPVDEQEYEKVARETGYLQGEW